MSGADVAGLADEGADWRREILHIPDGTARISTSADPRLPIPGTVLVRQYKGRTVRATVLDDAGG